MHLQKHRRFARSTTIFTRECGRGLQVIALSSSKKIRLTCDQVHTREADPTDKLCSPAQAKKPINRENEPAPRLVRGRNDELWQIREPRTQCVRARPSES